MRVLIADDSALVRKSLAAMVSRIPGIEVCGQAEDGCQALDLVKKFNPEVVILDIRMPLLNGINVLEKIKRERANTCVIMITNFPLPAYNKRCMELGADYFFDKSEDFKKIPDALKLMLKGVERDRKAERRLKNRRVE